MIEIAAEGIDYHVFGSRLRSQLEFPDLSPAQDREIPERELHVRMTDPPEPIEQLGTQEIERGWTFRLFRVEDGLILEYGATGCYGIHAGGRMLAWYPDQASEIDPDLLLEMARAILLGPVMALALHESGILCLHGSAVAIEGRAVAFLAPKHFGKSTLALSLMVEGARLMSDDLVAIDASETPVALPGVHSVRLWRDVAERLRDRLPGTKVRTGFKETLTDLPRESLARMPVPLAAVYVVHPIKPVPGGRAAHRERLAPIEAATVLAHGKKLMDELVGLREAGPMLAWVAQVVKEIPIYRLSIVRDIERLSEVAREVMAWHSGSRSEETIP